MAVRVAHVITSLELGGAQAALYRLLDWQSDAATRTEVFSLTDEGVYGERISGLGVPVRTLGMRQGAPNPLRLFRLISWLRQSRPDVVQTWMYHADLVGGLAARCAGRLPVVWGIRHSRLEPGSTKPLTYRVAQACAMLSHRVPARIVCNSTASIEAHVAMGYERERMILIPNGIDLASYRPDGRARAGLRAALDIPGDAFVCGMVARYHKDKNFPLFIDAARKIAAECRDTRFVLCGLGVDRQNPELAGLVAASGLGDRIHLLGARDDVVGIMNAIDVLVSTSNSEAFPNVVAEAMACGTPCVVTDVGDCAVIVDDTGRIVPAGDVEGVAGACRDLLRMSPDARQEMGDAARRRIEQRYSARAMVDRFAEVVRSAAREN